LIHYTHTHTHTCICLLENKKANLNNVENLNKSIKLNKGRTMPIFNRGIGLSLFAFVKMKIVLSQQHKMMSYILRDYIKFKNIGVFIYRSSMQVRAGP